MFEIIAIIVIILGCAALGILIRVSKIEDLDEYIDDNYIISDPGDEEEHIYTRKDE